MIQMWQSAFRVKGFTFIAGKQMALTGRIEAVQVNAFFPVAVPVFLGSEGDR